MNSIEIQGLRHAYQKNEPILNGIDLTVPKGSIFGFLGKNGAGKTTTLRLILGLIKKQEGEIVVFGKRINTSRIEILQNLGSLIDSPSFYAHLSATDNLRILQKIYACPKERIAEVLEIVGLSHVGKKKVSQFSLGMKQRLSIAIALLHSPELLILDEPTNGLDPNGIIEMRELLKRLNEQNGITILVSSHLLAEIEKIITHLAIIDKGKVVFQGTYNELKTIKQKGNSLTIQTSDLPKSLEIILARGFGDAKIIEDHILIEQIEKEQIADLNRLFVNSGIDVFQLTQQEFSLESIFIHLTN